MRKLMRRIAVLAGAVAVMLSSGMGIAAASSGMGLAAASPPSPKLAFTPDPGNFGRVTNGQKSETFALENSGGSATGALTITVQRAPEFTITGTTCRGSLGPGMSCTVTVQLVAPSTACTSATLTAVGLKPAARATNVLTGAGVAFIGAPLYWTSFGSGTIGELNSTRCTALVTDQDFPWGVAVDSSHIYWANSGSTFFGGTIMKANLDGAGVTELVGGQDPLGVAVDTSNIYWANGAAFPSVPGAIEKAPLAGGPATTLVPGTCEEEDACHSVGVAVDTSNIYWTDLGFPQNGIPGTVKKAPLTGGPATTLVTGQDGPSGVAVENGYIYWADAVSGTIMRTNLNSCEPTCTVETLVGDQNSPSGAAVDSSHIYWTIPGNSGESNGTIMEANLNGTDVTTLMTGADVPAEVAVRP
jgi:hypothetical protein